MTIRMITGMIMTIRMITIITPIRKQIIRWVQNQC
jgi:hypothetical protein